MTAAKANPSRDSYHHGDLRAALLRAATELLEAGEPFSLRAVARAAGVSPTAPYRHFTDREALESALAVEGFRDLTAALAALGPPRSSDDLAGLAVVYVNFALDHPAVFRLMFGQECDDSQDARVLASGELRTLLSTVLEEVFPQADADGLAIGAWGLVHGLAFLHLDGKLPSAPRDAVADRVRAAFSAVLATQPTA